MRWWDISDVAPANVIPLSQGESRGQKAGLTKIDSDSPPPFHPPTPETGLILIADTATGNFQHNLLLPDLLPCPNPNNRSASSPPKPLLNQKISLGHRCGVKHAASNRRLTNKEENTPVHKYLLPAS